MYTQQIIQIRVIKSRVDAIMLLNIFGFLHFNYIKKRPNNQI